MHKNELFFDLVFLVTPLDPPLSLPPPYTPLEVGPLAIPAYKQASPIGGVGGTTPLPPLEMVRKIS